MRHAVSGRHARYPYRRPSPVSYFLVILAALAAFVAAIAFAGQSGQAQARQTALQSPVILADRGAEAVTAGTSATALARDKTVAARLAAGRVRAAATAAALTYTVRAGDSISAVAGRRCGASRDWTGIYALSRAKGWTAVNANVLQIGQHLWLYCAYVPGELHFAMVPRVKPAPVMAAVAHVSPAVRADPFDGHHGLCGDGDGDGMDAPCSVIFPHHYAAPVRTWHAYRAYRVIYRHHHSYAYHRSYAASSTYHGSSGCQAHIIADESGGNPRAVNSSSGAGGLYQFLPSTWHALGHSGLPENASVAEQTQAYYQQVAASGYSAWAASGGCG